MTQEQGEQGAGSLMVPLPPSPEALVADKYGLDTGEGAPSFLTDRCGPEGPHPPVSGNPGFRAALERPRSVAVPRSLVDWMACGPGPDDGPYRYDDYVDETFGRLKAVIIGGMKCRAMGFTGGRRKAKTPEGAVLRDARGRTLEPPYPVMRSTFRLSGPLGSASPIRLRLSAGVSWTRGEGRLVLRWHAEDAGNLSPWDIATAGGRFSLLDGTMQDRDVALMLEGVYSAVDLHQARRFMSRECGRLSAEAEATEDRKGRGHGTDRRE